MSDKYYGSGGIGKIPKCTNMPEPKKDDITFFIRIQSWNNYKQFMRKLEEMTKDDKRTGN